MARYGGKRPGEVFGYPIWNSTTGAEDARSQHWCPFRASPCNKRSRLIDFPFGVCSVDVNGRFMATCPRRFEEHGSIDNVPKVLEDIAIHYFGGLSNVIPFSEVRIPKVGSIDFVLVRHKEMKAEVDDFVAVEFQSDSTSGTGKLVQGLVDFMGGADISTQSYAFGMNTYDTIKRSITQLLNKGIVYEAWQSKSYWVFQEYIYQNLVDRYGFKDDGYEQGEATRFALYDLVPAGDRLSLQSSRFISTSVDEIYRSMRENPDMPRKDRFVADLTKRLRARLSLRID